MSTRSRRSGVGDGGTTLNPTTIQLLDRGRLTKELETRGLSTTGAKSVLADRLYDFVVNGIRDEPIQSEDIKPDLLLPSETQTSIVSAETTRKRNKNDSINESQPDANTPKPKRGRKSASTIKNQKETKEIEEPNEHPFVAFLRQRDAEIAVKESLRRSIPDQSEELLETTEPSKLVAVKEEPLIVKPDLGAEPKTRPGRKSKVLQPEAADEETPAPTALIVETPTKQKLEAVPTEAVIMKAEMETTAQEITENCRPKRNRIARVIATPPPEEPRRRSKPAQNQDEPSESIKSPSKQSKPKVEPLKLNEIKTEAGSISTPPPKHQADDIFDAGISEDESSRSTFDAEQKLMEMNKDIDYMPELNDHKDKKPDIGSEAKRREKEAIEAAKLERRRKEKAKEKERERRRLEKEKPKSVPITLQWAQVRAQLQKQQQEAKTSAIPTAASAKTNEPEKIVVKEERNTNQQKTPKIVGAEMRKPKTAQSRENVLDAILGDQQQFMKCWERKDRPIEITPDKAKAKLLEEKAKQIKLLEENNRKEKRQRLSAAPLPGSSTSIFDPSDPNHIPKIPVPPPMPQLIIPPRPKNLPPPSTVYKPVLSTTPETTDTQPPRLVPPPPPPKLKPLDSTLPTPHIRVPPPPPAKPIIRIPPPPPRPSLPKTIKRESPKRTQELPEIESPDPETSFGSRLESFFEEGIDEELDCHPVQQSSSIPDQFVEVLKELRDSRDVEECLIDMVDFVCSMGENSAEQEEFNNPNSIRSESPDPSLENSESIGTNDSTSNSPIEELNMESEVSAIISEKVIALSEEKQPEKENAQQIPRMDMKILSDPVKLSEMLKKANDVLTSFVKNDPPEPKQEEVYAQETPNEEELEAANIEEERPMPEFHGEPVPSDDDDALFEAAAGIPPSKRTKKKKRGEEEIEEETLPPEQAFQLDYYNADLHIKCDCDKEKERWWIVHPDNSDGLALMWGGVKTTFGLPIPYNYEFPNQKKRSAPEIEILSSTINGIGKENRRPRRLAFQIKITENLSIKHVPFEESEPHEVRVGFALGTSPNILGESTKTWCLCSSGKRATNNVFTDWARASFSLGDIVTTELDLDSQEISFWINGSSLGVAYSSISLEQGDVIFPTISAKNCKVAVNLGNYPDKNEEWGTRDPDWTFPAWLDVRTLSRARIPPEYKGDCTVLMMVGLPGVGKTTWVRHYLRDHPDEEWTLISPDTILNQMKVNGVPRSRVHRGRWDMVMGLAAKSMNRYITFACRRRRNYVIDATNCSRDSRKRKLTNFKDFRRKCVVIMPTDEEWQSRLARQARQDAKAIMPVECMLELKATLAIPNPETEPLEEVHFIEPTADFLQQAVDLVQRYNEEARPWLQNHQRSKKRRYGQQNENRSFNGQNSNSQENRQTWSLMSSLQAFAHQTPLSSPVTGPLKLTITDLGGPPPQLSVSTPTVSTPDPFAASAALASSKSISTPTVMPAPATTTLPPLSVSTDTLSATTTPSTPSSSRSAEAIAAAALKYIRPAGIPRSQLAKLSKAREEAILGFHNTNEAHCDNQPASALTSRPSETVCSPIPTIGAGTLPSPSGLLSANRAPSPTNTLTTIQQIGSTSISSLTMAPTPSTSVVTGSVLASASLTPGATSLPDFSQPPPSIAYGASSQVGTPIGGILDFSIPPPSFGMPLPGTPTGRPIVSPSAPTPTTINMNNSQVPQYPGLRPNFTQPPPTPTWPNNFPQPPYF